MKNVKPVLPSRDKHDGLEQTLHGAGHLGNGEGLPGTTQLHLWSVLMELLMRLPAVFLCHLCGSVSSERSFSQSVPGALPPAGGAAPPIRLLVKGGGRRGERWCLVTQGAGAFSHDQQLLVKAGGPVWLVLVLTCPVYLLRSDKTGAVKLHLGSNK